MKTDGQDASMSYAGGNGPREENLSGRMSLSRRAGAELGRREDKMKGGRDEAKVVGPMR